MINAQFFEPLEQRMLLSVADLGFDPITPNNPLWTAQFGTVSVDGRLTGREWAHAQEIFQTQPYHDGSSVRIKMLHNNKGLFLGADIRDAFLWADGDGGGTGGRFKTEQDDSLTIFFDPNDSRDLFLQDDDRALSINLAGMNAPIEGSGAVSRWKYFKGDGAGGGSGVNPFGALDEGIVWATQINGTVNDNSDIDQGWTVEIFMPWSSLGMDRSPKHGQTIGMLFDVIFDTTGGTRDLAPRNQSTDPAELFGPTVIDDHLAGPNSSFSVNQPGHNGPVNYAELMFVNPRHVLRLRATAVGNLKVRGTTGYSTRLEFFAPSATLGGDGHVSAYQIRRVVGTSLTDANWATATVVENRFVPKLAGLTESLKIGELSPGTTYTFALRGVDAAGRLGLLNSITLTTQTTAQDTSAGRRVMVSPMGSTLMTEAGDPFLINGDHLVPNGPYVRGLYPGEIWFDDVGEFRSFADRTPVEGAVGPYMDLLAASGITTMRAVLEQLTLAPAGRTNLPSGMYWLESSPGVFNQDMKAYLHGLMAEADRVGIRLTLHPFNTFNFRTNFELSPFASINGGPLDTIDDFFQSPEVLAMVKARIETIIDWVNESPFSATVIGIEMLNEWDSFGWTLNPEGDAEPSRATEMRTRSRFVVELARHARAYDPNIMVMSSTIGPAPRGPVNRALFLSDVFDILAPHFYTNSSEQPVNNPATDRSFRPAQEAATLGAYWLTQRRSNTPVYNGEWGLTQQFWTDANGDQRSYYSDVSPNAPAGRTFLQSEDEAQFRTIAWSSLAAGLQSPGNRITGPELRDLFTLADLDSQAPPLALTLSTAMRGTQGAVSRFFNDTSLGFDATSYDPSPLTGRIEILKAGGSALSAWGSTDGTQGLVYVLQDRNVSTGLIAPHLLITGLRRGSVYDAQVWSTGADAHVIKQLTGITAFRDQVRLKLPAFDTDVMIKFKARQVQVEHTTVASAPTGGGAFLVNFSLDSSGQPAADLLDTVTGAIVHHNVAAMARFTGSLVDLIAYERPGGRVTMIGVDANHEVWLFNGAPSKGVGSWEPAKNLSQMRDLPGIVGDLAAEAIEVTDASGRTRLRYNIFGLDSRSQIISYESSPRFGWVFRDLARRGADLTIQGGLSAFELPDAAAGMGIAGLSAVGSDGQIVVLLRNANLGSAPNEQWTITDLAAITPVPATGKTQSLVVGSSVSVITTHTNGSLSVLTSDIASPDSLAWDRFELSASVGLPTVAAGTVAVVDGDRISIVARSAGGDLLHLSGLASTWSFDVIGSGLGSFDAGAARGRISVITQQSIADDAVIFVYDGVNWS